MIWCATGHRPDKLGGYGQDVFEGLILIAEVKLEELKPEHMIIGMALGWDTAVGYACYNRGIPYTAAIPCKEQTATWFVKDVTRWKFLVEHAARVEYIGGSCYSGAYLKRNIWMVDGSEAVLALWNGNHKGGTAHCVRYAISRDRPITNCWKDWNPE